MATTRGIKKVSEHILSDGRAIIVTEKNKDNYAWSDIPNGSLFIDTVTGIMQVKVEGENDWIPAGIKNDGTICIAKDAYIKKETFTIDSLDDGEGNFVYTNIDGQTKHMPLQDDGTWLFELEKGEYQPQRNSLEVVINDVLHRNEASGGVIPVDGKRFKLNEANVAVGQEISVSYLQVLRIGNPYPRIFTGPVAPTEAEEGDLWLDTNSAPYDSKEVEV